MSLGSRYSKSSEEQAARGVGACGEEACGGEVHGGISLPSRLVVWQLITHLSLAARLHTHHYLITRRAPAAVGADA